MAPAQLLSSFPKLKFTRGDTFVWSPAQGIIYYDPQKLSTAAGQLALLHEIGHAQLQHQTYELDTELIDMEVAAWEKAKQLAVQLGIYINENHINDCLETYRVWLFKRSRCPTCENTGLQISGRSYNCFLCGSRWQVAATRSLQPRRMKCNIPQIV